MRREDARGVTALRRLWQRHRTCSRKRERSQWSSSCLGWPTCSAMSSYSSTSSTQPTKTYVFALFTHARNTHARHETHRIACYSILIACTSLHFLRWTALPPRPSRPSSSSKTNAARAHSSMSTYTSPSPAPLCPRRTLSVVCRVSACSWQRNDSGTSMIRTER